MKALETLCRRFPDIGWRICIQQFEGGKQIAHPSARPRWRNDAAGAGRGVTGHERYEFARKALDLAISWPAHDKETLGDLVERLASMPDQDKLAVCGRIDSWSRPCRPVCDVLEAIASEDMASGFEIGDYNGRGVTTRGAYEDGEQERDLAARHRAWARRFEYPCVHRQSRVIRPLALSSV